MLEGISGSYVRCLAGAVTIILSFVLHQPSRAVAAGIAHAAYHQAVQIPGQPPVKLYAEEMGAGRPILLIHGLGGSSYTWRHVAPELARNHRVVAVDLKGFGRSEKPFDLAYSPIDQALLIADFIARRNLTGLTIVGHSFGGAVALITALELNRRSPGRLRRLVLMDSPAYPQQFSAMVSFLRLPVVPYVALTLMPPELPVRKALAPGNGKPSPYSERDFATYSEPLSEAGARHAIITTAREIVPEGWPRLIARYRTIRQPTLILWCRDDPVVPISSGYRLLRTLPNARIRIVEGCEHIPPDETPTATIKELRDFLVR